MNRALIVILTLGLLISTTAAERAKESIIGVWRFTKSESSDKKYKNPTGDMEMEFREGGKYVMKYVAPKAGVKQVQTVEAKFTLIAPDRVNVSLDGKTQEKYRYKFNGGLLQLEHTEFPVTNTFKRIDKFTLK
ncbi:MAG: hypothetical protein JWQ71_153 [Pedosphaera sp.]|nr:hypothetical protein [Pedosphaera sp.]